MKGPCKAGGMRGGTVLEDPDAPVDDAGRYPGSGLLGQTAPSGTLQKRKTTQRRSVYWVPCP